MVPERQNSLGGMTDMESFRKYDQSNHQDHAHIVEIGAELWGIMTNPMYDRDRVAIALNLLRSSMMLHFADEESEMRRCRYPGADQHVRSHKHIIDILADFMSAFAVGRESTAIDLWPHLEHTLETHMARYDAEFAAHLAAADQVNEAITRRRAAIRQEL